MKVFRKYKFLLIILMIILGAGVSYFYFSKKTGFIQRSICYLAGRFFKEKDKPTAGNAQEVNVFSETEGAKEGMYVPVKAVKVKRDEFRDVLSYFGTIKGFREVNLRFSNQGVVKEIMVEESQKAAKEDIIAVLEQEEVNAKLKYAELEYEKNKKLFSLGGISEGVLKRSELQLKLAQIDIEKTYIKAPCSGVIGAVNIETGEFVIPQDKAVVLLDIKEVFCEAGVTERDIPKIKLGQDAEIFVDAYPRQSFSTKVENIFPAMEGNTRMQIVRFKLDNAGELLKPGMFAKVNITAYHKDNTLVIPTSALKEIKENWYVYAVSWEDEENSTAIVNLRKVNIGFLGYELSQIEDGLQEDELIAADTAAVKYSLEEGTKVKIISINE